MNETIDRHDFRTVSAWILNCFMFRLDDERRIAWDNIAYRQDEFMTWYGNFGGIAWLTSPSIPAGGGLRNVLANAGAARR